MLSLLVLAVGAVAVALTMTATALVARRIDRVSVIDVVWGPGLLVVTIACAAGGALASAGDQPRSLLLVAMVGIWALRLAWHIRRRAVRLHEGAEDPRYLTLLGGPLHEAGMAVAVRRVFLVQGAAMWLVSLPVMVAMAHEATWAWAIVPGLLVWGVGVVFEAVGDRQLAAYQAIPRGERAPVLDTGLWRYTRHPNYFGDACVAWGVWLTGGLASGWLIGALTVIAPVAMTYFLVFATGARHLERTMMQRPGYPAYAARTSMFFPLPPRP